MVLSGSACRNHHDQRSGNLRVIIAGELFTFSTLATRLGGGLGRVLVLLAAAEDAADAPEHAANDTQQNQQTDETTKGSNSVVDPRHVRGDGLVDARGAAKVSAAICGRNKRSDAEVSTGHGRVKASRLLAFATEATTLLANGVRDTPGRSQTDLEPVLVELSLKEDVQINRNFANLTAGIAAHLVELPVEKRSRAMLDFGHMLLAVAGKLVVAGVGVIGESLVDLSKNNLE